MPGDGTEAEYLGAERPNCDIHFYEKNTTVPALYDGKTKQGRWANMCQSCFEIHGVGLGTGKGQKLTFKEDQRRTQPHRPELTPHPSALTALGETNVTSLTHEIIKRAVDTYLPDEGNDTAKVRAYNGRGYSSNECVGVTLRDTAQLVSLGIALATVLEEETVNTGDVAVFGSAEPALDSMGRDGIIAYWSNVPFDPDLSDDEDDEDDGE
jgi:hypothetical protein